MAYINSTQLANRFALLTQWTDDDLDGSADSAVVAEIIDIAVGDVDRYCGQVYAVPLTLSDASTARQIKSACGAIAGYRAASRRTESVVPQNLKDEYEQAIKWLESVAAGSVHLEGETVIPAPKPGSGIVIAGDDITLTHESMDGL